MSVMNEQELIKQIAKPIIDLILRMEDEQPGSFSEGCPQIRLIAEEVPEGMDGQDSGYNRLLLQKIEAYIQNELEQWYRPVILH